MNTQQVGGCLYARNGIFTRTCPRRLPNNRLPASRSTRNKFPEFKPPGLWYFNMALELILIHWNLFLQFDFVLSKCPVFCVAFYLFFFLLEFIVIGSFTFCFSLFICFFSTHSAAVVVAGP